MPQEFGLNMDIGRPRSVEGPSVSEEVKPTEDTANANYRGSESRCYNCDHFEDPGTCRKGVNGGQVEPEAGCNLFKALETGESAPVDEVGTPE